MTTRASFLKAAGRQKEAVTVGKETIFVTTMGSAQVNEALEFKAANNLTDEEYFYCLVCLCLVNDKDKQIFKIGDYTEFTSGAIQATIAAKIATTFNRVNHIASTSENVKN